MRFVLIAVGVVLALVSGTLMSPVAREPGRRSGRSFEWSALPGRRLSTKELASRIPWPATPPPSRPRISAPGPQPIRLVRGRAAWWSEPEQRRGECRMLSGVCVGASGRRRSCSSGYRDRHLAVRSKDCRSFTRSNGSNLSASRSSMQPGRRNSNSFPPAMTQPSAWTPERGRTGPTRRPCWRWIGRCTRRFSAAPQRNPAGRLESEQRPLGEGRRAMKQGGDAGLSAIRAVLAEGVPLSDHGWAEVANFAQAGAADLAVDIRSRHRPVGRCSIDLGPQEAARQYAELCFAAGKLSCFLNCRSRSW